MADRPPSGAVSGGIPGAGVPGAAAPPGPWYRRGRPLLAEIFRATPSTAGGGRVHVWFLGQHGFVVSLAGLTIYIDVILNDFVDAAGRSRRRFPPPFSPEETAGIDLVLCTHNHTDHLNLATLVPLARANPTAVFAVPRPLEKILVNAGISPERVLGARAGESFGVNGRVEVTPVAAAHGRYAGDGVERDGNGDAACLGYALRADGVSVYHAGDTWVTPDLVSALRGLAPLDLALLPINGTDWERTAAGCVGNMSPLDAARLAAAVPFDLVIPAHYNLFADNAENPAVFADCMYRLYPGKRFHICALGERFVYEK